MHLNQGRKDDPGEKKIKELSAEIEQLRQENTALKGETEKAFRYIREKVNQLLLVMGTAPLKSEELDDNTLIELDPIGIVSDSFIQILDNLRQTNKALTVAKDEIQAVFDSSGAALLVLDPERHILTFNEKARESFFSGETPCKGATCREEVCEGKTSPEDCVFEKVMRSGKGEHWTEWVSDERYFDVIGTPIKDSSGIISHVVLAYNDITERKHSEKQLRDALQQSRDDRDRVDWILRSVGDGLIVTDTEERILLLNEKAGKILGIRLANPVGAPLADAVRNKTLQEYIREFSMRGEETPPVDFILPGTDRQPPSVFQARGGILKGKTGEKRGMITVFHEVTRERELERIKSEFITTAAHELRTPLAAILGFSELLQERKKFSEAEEEEFAEIIHEKAQYLSDIVNDLLDISRIESGKPLSIKLETHPLQECFERFITSFRKSTPNHHIRVDFPDAPLQLHVDRRAICQVMENLLNNAVKYSPDGGEIVVTARPSGKDCLFTIRDEGIGMTKEQIERAFETFYRADASNTAIRGTGLGLTIVKLILDAHGGVISLESSPGKGTTVHFTLPLAADIPVTGKAPGAPSSSPG